MTNKNYNTLRLILGDQLNLKHSWYDIVEDGIVYFIAEMRQDTDYLNHHIQKVVAFFASMRNMAEALEDRGHHVIYYTQDDPSNTQSLTDLDESYAHHIQRLMITGNYALLAQVNSDYVDKWYLGIYIDAIEWIEITNTRGMSQWADGGIVATKPYFSSGSYINKMSNYCKDCHYIVKHKTEEDACPFNALYWNFLDDKKEYFQRNNRMSMMMRLLEKMDGEQLAAMKTRAYDIIANPDTY